MCARIGLVTAGGLAAAIKNISKRRKTTPFSCQDANG
jgi:hypothetical protein